MTALLDLSVSYHESFKAYDVRGMVGEMITTATGETADAAFVDVLGLAPQTVLIGCDMRPSSPEFAQAFARGTAARREVARARAAGEDTPVGHSFIKAVMAAEDAVFGGEHSAHYYFRDFSNADTGMLAARRVLAALDEQDTPLSALAHEYEPYVSSREINSKIEDKDAAAAASVLGSPARKWTRRTRRHDLHRP